MGVRKEGSGKSRSTSNNQPPAPHASRASGAAADNSAIPAEKGSDEDSDPELQEVYVQSYACQIFRDDAAAASVEDGVHLRPLTASQEPGAEPLMLDRFDARWMLDLSDFKKGEGSSLPAKLMAEERQADRLRYAGLPSGDHSLVVEGLNQFAPTGSYAHGGNRGGLGDDDDDDEEPPPEVYGYYGRTASPPPTSATTGSGAWAMTPAPHCSVENDQKDGAAAAAAAAGDGDGENRGAQPKEARADGAEEFVPDFGIPEGVVAPATVRQHMMMVGTARTAVRSPQLEVLLRLKQQSNLAFSFLSDEDPVHRYYVFLKSWGESALAAEYARQQRLQAGRVETRRREEEQRKEREERAAAAATAAKESTSHPLLPAEAGFSDDSDAPNLLGGAYESSEDEEGPISAPSAAAPGISAATVAAPATRGITLPLAAGVGLGAVAAGRGASSLASPLAPDEEKREVVEKMVGYVAKNGQAFEDRVRNREKSNSTFDFLVPTNQFHAYYKMRLALARGDGPAAPATAAPQGKTDSAATGGRNDPNADPPATVAPPISVVADSKPEPEPASTSASQRREAGQSSGSADSETTSNGGAAAEACWEGITAAGVSAAASSADTASIADSRVKLGAKLGLTLSRIDEREGKNESSSRADLAPTETGRKISTLTHDEVGEKGRAKIVVGAGSPSSSAVGAGEVGSNRGAAAAGVANPNPASVEDAETRRANRLKRARLMTGHYKLAVMEHSSDQQEKDNDNENTTAGGGGASTDLTPGARPSGGVGGVGGGDGAEGSDGLSSADGLSDLDDTSSGDESESGGDAGGGAGDAAGGKASAETSSGAEGKRASTATEGRDSKSRSRDGGDAYSSTARKHKPSSNDSTRYRGRRGEDDGDGVRRHGRGQQKSKQSSGSEIRRDKGRAGESLGDDRMRSRKGRSRSRSASRGRVDGGDRDGTRGERTARRPGSEKYRSSGVGNRTYARDRKDGGRGERSEGDHHPTSKSSSSRKSDSRENRDREARVGGSRERGREQPRSDRAGVDSSSSSRRRANVSRHEKEREKSSRRRSRSRDRGESRERGGSKKRSRR